jgi:hypothetical protein
MEALRGAAVAGERKAVTMIRSWAGPSNGELEGFEAAAGENGGRGADRRIAQRF